MNAVTPIEASAASAADILAEFEADAGIVLIDPAKAEALYAASVAEVEAFTPDVSTQKGRDAITSFSFKFTKRKTAIQAAAKAKTEAWRKQTDAVNAARRVEEQRFEALAARAKKPLTDWQAEEDAKAARRKAAFDYLQNAPVVLMTDNSDTLAARLEEVRGYLLPNDFEPEDRDGCERLRGVAIAALTAAIAEARQKEQDLADLARLRAQEAERQAAAPPPAAAAPDAPIAVQPPAPPPPPAPAPDQSALVAALGRAKADLMKVCGLDEATAKAVVLAIGRDQIAHLTLTLESRNAG